MKINELETHLIKMILDNWDCIESVVLFNFNDDNIHIELDISDCEGEFWCEKNKIERDLFVKMKKCSLSLKNFFSDQWGIRLIKKAENITIR